MKKSLAVLLVLCLLAAVGMTGCKPKPIGKLYLYNWTEYIPQDVFDLFEEETGIRVVESTYSSNEQMLAKLDIDKDYDYDVLVPSSYVIETLKEKDLIQPINTANIPNFANVDPSVLNRDFDPGNQYSVPYMATMTVIAVNREKIANLGVEIQSLNDLLDPRLEGQIVCLDDSRELVDAALKATIAEPDYTSKEQIESTLPWLLELKKNVAAFDSDSPYSLIASNEVAVGLVYNIDAGQAIGENDAIDVVYTTEPCELAIDNFVITKNAKNVEYAEKFIDFIHRPEVYKMILDEFPGVCLNNAALAILGPEYLDNAGSNVDKDELARAHLTSDVGDAGQYYDEIFNKMKAD
ncbi:MAG: spermidine/putrescine ABC transporter substrate-binding protein [Oscillospiraceae bacterium]|jgi:spermidine/putrescine-binding protein|nr:spermidine/putrescine ABC transporter substrate-binding protein [Oscillospiraceae bacterium]